MAVPKKKQDAIEGLSESLNSRAYGPKLHINERTPLSNEREQVLTSWSDIRPPKADPAAEILSQPLEPAPGRFDPFHEHTYTTPNFLRNDTMTKKRGMSFSTKFFLASLAFFLIAIGVAGYLFVYGGNTISPQNIDMQVVAPSMVDGGKQSSLQVLISNRNQSPLQLVDLVVDYPDGTRDPNNPTQTLSHERQTIGDIASGEQVKRVISAIFYGQQGTQQTINATLEYSIPGSNSIFEKQVATTFLVGSSPVSVTVGTPTEAIAGQQFSFDVTVQSNSASPIDNVLLQGQYPFGFSVLNSTPPSSAGGTVWRLGTLAPGASQTVHITGTIDGQDGDQRVFRFFVGSDADQTDTVVKVPFLSVPQTLTVRRPFISATIALGSQSGKNVTAVAGSPQTGTITWQNNLPDAVSNMQVVLALSGPALDSKSVNSTNGFYQSTNNTITWTKDQQPELANVPPGGSGTLNFTFSTLPPGSGGMVYANPTVNLTVSVSGVRPGQDSVPETITSAATTQVSLSSLVGLTATALHFSGAFQNTGPMPPVVGQATSYAIVWTATNSSNTIANAVATATLPPYVQYLGAASGSGISYDAQSRTVTWNIGDLKAGAGYSGAAVTGTFQVALTPSISQVGNTPPLTGIATLHGQDRFANVQVQTTAVAPTTLLGSDGAFTQSMAPVSAK